MYDKVIIGAGLYGLYAARKCIEKGEKVLVLEKDGDCFGRATYINQARVHMGYHYPRSLSTAMKSAGYFSRFLKDYSFCVHQDFDQIYATSSEFSWTNREQFISFCEAAGIYYSEVSPRRYFKKGMCDGAFLTREYTYDARILRKYFVDYFQEHGGAEFVFHADVEKIEKGASLFSVLYSVDGKEALVETPFVLNATYSGVNQIIEKAAHGESDFFKIKYELCEIILCKPDDALSNIGLTVMDGPFFSIMPFGKTGLHSLTSVCFTPHTTSYDLLPTFPCQKREECCPTAMNNCNECASKPRSAWPYMSHLAGKYVKDELSFQYEKSLFSMKPILISSEVDDSRPTQIRVLSEKPTFISVLSGKINTVYDLDQYL